MGDRKTQIVIVGGGAGGLELARKLGARYGRKRHDIILAEKNRTHIWKPLLHEVAAGSLDANLDEVGYRSHCHRWGYRYFYGRCEGVDTQAKEVMIAPLLDDDGSVLIEAHRVRYDYLVLAMGSVGNDFGTPGARANCIFLDDRHAADRFRNKLLDHCLRVSRLMAADPASDARVRIAIVGGGATGVELAAELYNAAAALRFYGLEVFDETRLEVTLLEAGPRILPALPERLADAARAELQALGVSVCENTRVTEVTGDAILTADGGRIAAELKVWAAGVRGATLDGGDGGLELNRTGQFLVRPTMQTTRDDRIFALGDCASYTAPGADKPIPPRAQAAHQMAATVYHNLRALMESGRLQDFVYRDYGSLVSLSRYSTVGSLMGNLIGGRMAIEGRLARLVYQSLYGRHLIGINGWARGIVAILVSQANAIVRPKLKLH